MKRILITGGFGFVGGRLVRRLATEYEVWVTSRKEVSEEMLRLHGNPRWIDHALVLSTDTFPAFIDTVVHLASLNETDCVKYPSDAIRVNVDETRMVLENSISRKVRRFIYFSTAHVYGSPLRGRLTEETLTRPAHPYAITHKAAEDYVLAASMQSRIQGTVFRLSNAFGAPVAASVNRWSLLANDLCRQAVEKEKITLNSNGCQRRDFICLTDVEEVIARFLSRTELPEEYLYNLGSGTSMRVIDMAEAIIQSAAPVLQKNITLELPADAEPAVEGQLEFSIDRLLAEGYRLKNDTGTELKQLLQFCKKHFSVN